MCCVQSYAKELLMFEILAKNQIITVQLYTERLKRLAKNIMENYPLHDYVKVPP